MGASLPPAVPLPRLSPLPIVGDLKCPYQPLQVSSVDVLLTVLGDFPGLSAVGVGDAVDPLHPVGLQHQGRFGDQHRVSVRLVCLSLQGHRCPKRKPRASSGTGTGQLDIRTEPHSE